MKCQAGNNSNGRDTRGIILLQTKNPNRFGPKQAEQRPPAAAWLPSACSVSGHGSGSRSSFLPGFYKS